MDPCLGLSLKKREESGISENAGLLESSVTLVNCLIHEYLPGLLIGK